MTSVITPNWPTPGNIGAAITTRQGGCSRAPFDSNNLALHVGDAETAVQSNRKRLAESLGLSQQPLWLNQVHGTEVIYVPEASAVPTADASFTDRPEQACAIMTADCLPVLFCDQQGTQVAAAHAGWRGLCHGILRKTVASFARPDQVMAYLGPAIGPQVFEVGAEVLEAFVQGAQGAQQIEAIQTAFLPSQQGKYLTDLYALARAELTGCGVSAIYGGDYCTLTDSSRFYSYRREAKTGRMASLVWLKNS
ncbi:peptidoglycan editing factor PgeF [Porticoccaceae bacterium]|nr:peptidoglycan editing factor PgeF [Porticoccaceae bacterium]